MKKSLLTIALAIAASTALAGDPAAAPRSKPVPTAERLAILEKNVATFDQRLRWLEAAARQPLPPKALAAAVKPPVVRKQAVPIVPK